MLDKRRSKRLPGWVPDQHGAWLMVTVPILIGISYHPALIHLPLALTWWFGYFTFYAASVWLRSKFKSKHLPPVLTYGCITCVCGLITLFFKVQLLVWAPVFAPLVAIAVFETWKGRPRSMLSGEATVLAATLMTPVAVYAATSTVPANCWWVFAVLTGYYTLSIPYVKTLIRKRNSPSWWYGSLAAHLFLVAAAALAAMCGKIHWFALVLALVFLLRAWLLPALNQRRPKPLRPMQVGAVEIGLTVPLVVAALLTPGFW